MASSLVVSSSTFEALSKRYSNAYKVAKGLVACGNVAEIGGAILGVVLLLVGAYFTITGGFLTGLPLVGIAIVVLISSFIAGVLIRAIGQMMLTMIDTAVNTSTLIPEEEKAKIIGV